MNALMLIVSTRAQRAAATLNDSRWPAVVARDPSADGRFYFAGATTGVFCRPSCGARPPRPENVRFFTTPAAAQAASFRSCKRCKPLDASLQATRDGVIACACCIIETREKTPPLTALAAELGLSAAHFHRQFKAATGLTPRAYAAAHREGKLRSGLAKDTTVTAAVYEAGYTTASRFYKKSDAILGMTPRRYKAGAPGSDIAFATGRCSLSYVLAAQSEKGICAILLGDDPKAMERELKSRFPKANLTPAGKIFAGTLAKVTALIDDPARGLNLPFDVRGTAFQKRVWQVLAEIPPGKTTTYSALAKRVGKPKAVRAVGSACGANPLDVIVSCHRALRSDGDLGGYYWGLKRKQAMLKKQAVRSGASVQTIRTSAMLCPSATP